MIVLSDKFSNITIAGTLKWGISSLFFWIAVHPETCASKVKKDYFLADEISRHNKALNTPKWFGSLPNALLNHCHSQKIRLEAIPSVCSYDTSTLGI